MADLEAIQKKIISFRNERDWAQFHDPKNLAEALYTILSVVRSGVPISSERQTEYVFKR